MYQPSTIEQEAIALVMNERIAWETVQVFVTQRVAFKIRPLLQEVRKNYWSIYSDPFDKVTGRKKIFIPLTESLVEACVKNIDLDTKDITFAAKQRGKEQLAQLVRSITKDELEKFGFGEAMDEFERDLAINGTAIWKTIQVKDGKEYKPKVYRVDLLNWYMDPGAKSIQEAYRATERSLMDEDEIKNMSGWINTDNLVYNTNLHPTDTNLSTTTGTSRYRDVWEMWGKIPKRLITGNKDDNEDIDGHIIVSGIQSQAPVCHLIELNKSGIKPYEEAWYTRVPGRWYGRGVGEKILMLQLWINTIVNIRINRSFVSQLGLFKIRRGSGITPQSLSNLPANGAIVVSTMDDIEQLAVEEASQASYQDEQGALEWARMVTSAYEAVTGENMPASTSATIGAIQAQNAKSQFALIREGVGMFLQRWLKRHFLPVIFKNIQRGDIIRHYPDELSAFDELVANELIDQKLDEFKQAGILVTPEQVELEKQRIIQTYQKRGNMRFVKLGKELDVTEYDVEVDITGETMDKGVMVTNLIQLLPVAAEYRQDILTQLFDLLGLRPPKAQAPQMMPPVAAGTQNPVQQMTQANTAQMAGQSPVMGQAKPLTQLANG